MHGLVAALDPKHDKPNEYSTSPRDWLHRCCCIAKVGITAMVVQSPVSASTFPAQILRLLCGLHPGRVRGSIFAVLAKLAFETWLFKKNSGAVADPTNP
mmetsp:Transcript_69140/g.144133  ORF Transcript_69140/g.144133 Transcript_69140/m.144133 type:complete len:99 (+) Transcript_69140:166-462(+)